MRFLLDTHSLIWFLTNDPHLSENLKSQIEDTANQTSISIASLWEIGVKYSLKKLDLQVSLENFFETVRSSSLEIRPILPDEILLLSQLPFHHRDPFDRLIIAQAQAGNLTIIGKDKAFLSYSVTTHWH